MLQMKFDRIRVPEKNASSTPALSKPDMGPQSSPNARSDDEVSALQRSVSHCRHLGHVWCRKVFLHDLGGVRQKLWQLAGEIQIVADNDRDRSLQNLRLIRFRSKPGERCLSIGATHPDKPRGATVRGCRAPFQEVINLAYQIVPYRTICPSVGGASGAKDMIKRLIAQSGSHRWEPFQEMDVGRDNIVSCHHDAHVELD